MLWMCGISGLSSSVVDAGVVGFTPAVNGGILSSKKIDGRDGTSDVR